MGHIIRLQYRSRCADCGALLERGTTAAYYGPGRVYGREGCHSEPTQGLEIPTGTGCEVLACLEWTHTEEGLAFARVCPDEFRIEVMPVLSSSMTPGLLALTRGEQVDCRAIAGELRDRVGLPLSAHAFEVLATSSAENVLVFAWPDYLHDAMAAISYRDSDALGAMAQCIGNLLIEASPHTLRCQHARESGRLKALLRDALLGAPALLPQLGSGPEPRITWLSEGVNPDARLEFERIALQRRPRALAHGEQEVDEIVWNGRPYRITWYLSDFGQVTGSVAG